MSTAGARVLAIFVMALTICAIAFSLWQFWLFSSGGLLSDFRAFYCAGRLAGQGVDPYRQEPLYSCEAEPASPLLWRAVAHVTDPAPLPPYALAVFVPLSRLPLGVAAVVWTAVLCCAWILVALACRAVTQQSWRVCVASIAFAAMMSLSLGQIAPLAIAAVCCAGLSLASGRDFWAGVCAGVAMVEPHVALPVCIAVFIAVPRARLGLGGVAAAFVALTLAFGLERNIEYLQSVLPAHEISDVADVGQFSLTVLAHVLGLADEAAARAGAVWYGIVAVAGIATAFALRARTANRVVIAFIPMAFAVFGGPYVHWQQVVGAIPAPLLLLRLSPNRSPLLAASLIALAVPWMYVVGWGTLIPGATAIAALLVWELFEPSAVRQTTIVIFIFVALLIMNRSLAHQPSAGVFVAHVRDSDWADLSWGAYVRARIPIGTGLFFWLHFVTWAGLAGVVTAASRRALVR